MTTRPWPKRGLSFRRLSEVKRRYYRQVQAIVRFFAWLFVASVIVTSASHSTVATLLNRA